MFEYGNSTFITYTVNRVLEASVRPRPPLVSAFPWSCQEIQIQIQIQIQITVH